MAASAQDSDAPPPAATPDPTLIRDGQLDLDAAVARFENLYRSASSQSTAELTVVRPGKTRSLRFAAWTRNTDRALIVVEAPPRERGTATLKVENNLWNYLPRIRRTIRIPPSMMLGAWMGSDFTNDDLVRESSYTDDYAYELAGPSTEPAGWRILFHARPGVAGLWRRVELLLSPDGRIPLQALYFDRRDRLSRTLLFDQVREFSGRRLPARMTMIPTDEPENRTIMTYLDISFEVPVPESMFSLSHLERLR